jgi:hypothetical protein
MGQPASGGALAKLETNEGSTLARENRATGVAGMNEVVAVKLLGGYRLWLKFKDGEEGELDMESYLQPFINLFEPLQDPTYFAKVEVIRAARTIGWPNGVELDPDMLHHHVTGKPLPF